jgi:hypothetical protein
MVSPKTQRNYTILQKKGKFFRLVSKKSVFSLFEKGPMYNKEKWQREKELEQGKRGTVCANVQVLGVLLIFTLTSFVLYFDTYYVELRISNF